MAATGPQTGVHGKSRRMRRTPGNRTEGPQPINHPGPPPVAEGHQLLLVHLEIGK